MKDWYPRPIDWDDYFSDEDEDRMSLDATEPEDCPFCGHDLFPLFDGTADRCTWCGADIERPPLRAVEDAS